MAAGDRGTGSDGSIRRRLFRIGRAEALERRRRREEKKNPTDPAAEILAAVRRQRDAVDTARRSVAELTVQRRRAEILLERAETEVEAHERAARLAVEHGDDEAARAALGRALAATPQRDRLGDQVAVLRNKEEDLHASVDRLEQHVRETESRRRALAADREAARASLTIAEAMRADGPDSAQDAVRAAEREIAEITGRHTAREELAWADPGSRQVADAFDSLTRQAEVEAELRRLHGERGEIGPGHH